MKKKTPAPKPFQNHNLHGVRLPDWMTERLEKIAKEQGVRLTVVIQTIVEAAFLASDADFIAKGGKL